MKSIKKINKNILMLKSSDEKKRNKAVKTLIRDLCFYIDEEIHRIVIGALGETDDLRVIELLVERTVNSKTYNPAAKALAELKDPRAIDSLNDKIESNMPARKVLGSYKDARVAEKMMPLLNEKNEYVRIGAILVLGYMKETAAVETIIKALDDEKDNVVRAAVMALDAIRDRRAAGALIRLLDNLMADAERRIREPLLLPLAFNVLGKTGAPEAVAYLIPVLSDKIYDTFAAKALGLTKSQSAVEPLLNVLSNKKVYKAAITALAEIESPGAVEPLIEALDAPDKDIQLSAAKALGGIKDPRAVKPLIEALASRNDVRMKKCAAAALAEIGDDRAIAPLKDLLQNRNFDLQIIAAAALVKMDRSAAEAFIIKGLNHPDTEKKLAVLKISGGIKDRGLVLSVLKLLKEDADQRIRRTAAAILGRIGDTQAVGPLSAALDDTEHVREAAVRALGSYKDDGVYARIVKALEDSSFYVRKAAAAALAEFGDSRAAGPLKKACDDPHSGVREAAKTALSILESVQTTCPESSASIGAVFE